MQKERTEGSKNGTRGRGNKQTGLGKRRRDTSGQVSVNADTHLKSTAMSPIIPEGSGVREKSSEIHYASDAQFTKALRKTSVEHAGLFRRLAE
jgi:hypothetical protein